MREFLEWFLSLMAVLGVLGGYLFHPALYVIGVPLWTGICLYELRRWKS